MLDLAVGGYSYESVRRALHFAGGTRLVSFRYELLGNAGVLKERDLRVYPGGSLSLDASAPIMRTARLEMRDPGTVDWQNDRIKIYFRLRMPDGGFAEWPLGVYFMPTAPSRRRGGALIRSVECYDMSVALQSDAVVARHYIPAGTRYTDAVISLMRGAGLSSVMIDEVPDALPTDREWEPYTTKAEIVATLLSEVNYTPLTADGNGIFRASRYVPDIARVPEYTYAADVMSVIREGGSLTMDAFSAPNVFVGVVSNPEMEDMSYVYENTSPTSPLSIQNRNGRRVVRKIPFDGIASMDVLQQATIRAADEASRGYEGVSFDTALMPHHEAGDCLQLESELVYGRFVERAWNITLQYNGAMRHSAERLVNL